VRSERSESAHDDDAGSRIGGAAAPDLKLCVRHLAHELRNTLSATTGWVHVLGHSAGPAEVAKAVEAIERNLRLHGALTEDLVDAAFIAGGGSLSAKAPIEIAPVLDQARSDVGASAQRRDIRVEVESDVGVRVQVEPDRLRRMLATLLRGVVEAAPRTSRVSVRATPLDASVEIRIEGPVHDEAAMAMPTGVRLVEILAQLHVGSLTAYGGDEGAPTAFALRLPRR
jgi:nitrogen-specific signal transduction histidine kinase